MVDDLVEFIFSSHLPNKIFLRVQFFSLLSPMIFDVFPVINMPDLKQKLSFEVKKAYVLFERVGRILKLYLQMHVVEGNRRGWGQVVR